MFQRIIRHLEGVEFRQFFTAGDDDGHRAAAGHGVEFRLGIVAFHEVASQFRHDAGGEAEVLGGPGHAATDGGHAHDGDAVAIGLIDQIGQVFQRLAFVLATDEDLDGEDAGVEAQGFLDAAGEAFIGKRLVTGASEFQGAAVAERPFPFFHRTNHARPAGGAQRDRFLRAGRHHGTLNATGEHETVDIRLERKDRLVHALEACRWPLEISMIESQHQRAAVLRVKNATEAVFQTPIVLVRSFEKKPGGLLRDTGEKFFGFFGGFAVEVSHDDDAVAVGMMMEK